ncbi:MAG TPA: alpha/beta hydrolase, partial [Dehalococcoidia bacterium]|nr:alpha/beta hydrolase [Dehalococcoidia bacterium]
MEPRIQYASTTDGVSIAFWTLGEGMPFVYMPGNPTTSTQSARQMPDVRRWYDRLAAERMLVRYDPRGGGLSDREVTDLSFDGRLLDLEAVADCLSLGRFVVFAYGLAGPQAIAYAARNPERVAHLVLWCTSSQPSEVVDVARLNALLGLADVDWELCTETLASDIMGWPVGEEARRGAAYLRENATPELLKAGLEAMV